MAHVSFPGLVPFCYTPTVDSSLVGSGTGYPVGMPLADAMWFYWKAKTFSIAVNTSGYVVVPALATDTFKISIDSNFIATTTTSLPDESGLVCGRSDTQPDPDNETFDFYDNENALNYFLGNNDCLTYASFATPPGGYIYSGSYYPFMKIELYSVINVLGPVIDRIQGTIPLLTSFPAGWSGYYPYGSGSSVACTILINGTSYSIPVFLPPFGEGFGNSIIDNTSQPLYGLNLYNILSTNVGLDGAISGTVSITAGDIWPYA